MQFGESDEFHPHSFSTVLQKTIKPIGSFVEHGIEESDKTQIRIRIRIIG